MSRDRSPSCATCAARRRINPETGASWAPPEVIENLARQDLQHDPALDDQRIDVLAAFIRNSDLELGIRSGQMTSEILGFVK